jgi:hypothetical protein
MHSQESEPGNFRTPSFNQIQRSWAAPAQRIGKYNASKNGIFFLTLTSKVPPGREHSKMKHSVPTSQDLEGCGSGRFPNHEARRPSAAAAASTTQNKVHVHMDATVPRNTRRTMSQNRSVHQEQSWRNIPKSSRLPSYAAAAALRRQQEEEEETQRYTQDPPTEMELIQVSAVLSNTCMTVSDMARYS